MQALPLILIRIITFITLPLNYMRKVTKYVQCLLFTNIFGVLDVWIIYMDDRSCIINTLKMLVDIYVFKMRLGLASQVLVVPHTQNKKKLKKKNKNNKKKTTKQRLLISKSFGQNRV